MSKDRAFYDSAVWRNVLRPNQLRKQPLCQMCMQLGRIRKATVVDHIHARSKRPDLERDPANLQSVCKPCHDGAKQEMEKTGTLRGCDINGIPLDPSSQWAPK